jgi:hypothetical protein
MKLNLSRMAMGPRAVEEKVSLHSDFNKSPSYFPRTRDIFSSPDCAMALRLVCFLVFYLPERGNMYLFFKIGKE